MYTRQEIGDTIKDMEMTRKKASTTAYQAFTPDNLRYHHRFWNYDMPAGIKGTPRRTLIDVDECAIELKAVNENYGHAVKGLRVRKIGNYGRGKCKFTLILAVEAGDPDLPASTEGSIELPRLWYRITTDAGTSTESYHDFINHDLIDKFNPGERQRVIMHDNLSSHKSDEIVESIYRRGHSVICRVPYRPHEAPIEFTFNMFAEELRGRWSKIKTEEQLVDHMHRILQSRAGMGGFNQLFIDCGYIW